MASLMTPCALFAKHSHLTNIYEQLSLFIISCINDAMRTHFHVLWDGLFFLHRKTTAISKRPYYTWQMCNIWWKVTAARLWWWDGIEWQKARIASSMILCAPPKMIWWKILLRRIFQDLYDCTPLHGGHPRLTYQISWTLPLMKPQFNRWVADGQTNEPR